MAAKVEGLISIASRHSVDDTVRRVQDLLNEKAIKLFALIDHSGEAEAIGFEMRPTKLLIFGSPRGGTPLMLAAPSSAIDLPLKALISQDEDGKVWITFNTPEYFQQRHGFPPELIRNIAPTAELLRKAAE
jgi:uncharacterized protein (DUF302 family)